MMVLKRKPAITGVMYLIEFAMVRLNAVELAGRSAPQPFGWAAVAASRAPVPWFTPGVKQLGFGAVPVELAWPMMMFVWPLVGTAFQTFVTSLNEESCR